MAHGFGIVGIPKRGGGPLVKPGPDAVIDWQHPLARGLVGCWLMTSATEVHNLAFNDRVAWVTPPTKAANHLTFDGVNDHAVYTDPRLFPAAVSVTARMRYSLSKAYIVVAALNGDSASRAYQKLFFRYNSLRPLLYLGTAGGFIYFEAATPTNLYDGAWRSISIVVPGTASADIVASSMYAGGKPQTVHSTNSAAQATRNAFVIGSALVDNTLAGDVQCMTLHNRALNPSEIARLHAEPYCFFWERRKTIFVPTGAAPPVATPRSFSYIIA